MVPVSIAITAILKTIKFIRITESVITESLITDAVATIVSVVLEGVSHFNFFTMFIFIGTLNQNYIRKLIFLSCIKISLKLMIM